MLTDPTEIALISAAKQPGVRNPERTRQPFHHIFDDYLVGQPFEGRLFLDLGPGQYDFGVLVRERGGEVVAVDNDPAVIALGRHRGHPCHEANLDQIAPLGLTERFDGIFCKYSCNSLRFADHPGGLAEWLDSLLALLQPDGWCWIAPWNGNSRKLPPEMVQLALATERDVYAAHGFRHRELSEEESLYYGVHGTTENRPIFTLGLPEPAERGEATKKEPQPSISPPTGGSMPTPESPGPKGKSLWAGLTKWLPGRKETR